MPKRSTKKNIFKKNQPSNECIDDEPITIQQQNNPIIITTNNSDTTSDMNAALSPSNHQNSSSMKSSQQKRKRNSFLNDDSCTLEDCPNPILSKISQNIHPITHCVSSSNNIPPLLQDAHQTLSSFLSHSFKTFSNDSVMIVGPGKSGKKHLVKYTLNNLKESGEYSFRTVYVNGIHIASDSQLLACVLDALAREKEDTQLSVINSSNNNRNSNLQLIESTVSDENHHRNDNTEEDDHFDEQATYVEFLNALKDFTNQSIVFILDHFENLCRKSGKMLYTITDTCHEHRLSIIIIGLTVNAHIGTCMDRRVRSRFSSRRIYTLLPRNAFQVSQIMHHYLSLPCNENDPSIEMYNHQLKNCLLDPDVVQLLEECVIHSSCKFIYNYSLKVFELIQCHLEHYPLSENSMIFTPNIFVKAFHALVNHRVNSKLSFIQRLNQCQLILLCAIKKMESLYSSNRGNSSIDINFETVFNVYMKFATGGAQSSNIRQEHVYTEGRTQIQLDKQVIFQSFLSLIDLKVIHFVSQKQIPSTRKDQSITKVRLNNIHPSQIDNEIERLFQENRLYSMNSEMLEWCKSTSL
ncbi:hypothetical protein C9374_003777 [Naegleria lovaniensis]|uniref:Origin recognition complex subunit 4 n=1 Tax=Naegleria lovaniensis TaxID=51637 RepID=A0AA88KQ92_NAELO|nr:uncharacterized protein C9374_003777 [Naegleria lovaniensis]KAG2394013.1 hypothetical protein C9374_003777 [Naegleria lovaniensis]